MSQNYNIDDILEEVRRKKASQPDNAAMYEPPRSATPSYERPGSAQREDTQYRPGTGQGAQRPRQETPRSRPSTSRPKRDVQIDSPFVSDASAQRPSSGIRQPRSGQGKSGMEQAAPRFSGNKSPSQAPRYRQQPEAGEREPVQRQAPRQQPQYSEDYSQQAQTRQVQSRNPRSRREQPFVPPEQDTRPKMGYGSNSTASDYPPEESYQQAYAPDYFSHGQDDEPAAAGFHDTQAEDFSVHIDLDEDDTDEAYSGEETQYGGHTGSDLIKSRWHQSFLEQERMEQPVPDDDFASPQDAPYVEQDLKKLRVGLLVRTISMVVITLLTTYLTFSVKYPPFASLLGEAYADPRSRLPLPFEFIYPDLHPIAFMSLMLILCVAGAIICSNIIAAGFGALFRFRANSDTPAALCVFSVLVQSVVLMLYPSQLESENVSIYIPVAMLVLLFTLIGKTMLARRITRNFHFLLEDKEKFAMLPVANRDFARELSRGLGPEVDQVAYCAQTDFITGFLSKSYTGDYSDNFYCVSAPISFLGSLLVGGLTFFLSKDLVLGVSVFAGTMCICAPLSSAIVPHLMLGRMSKWLCKRGAMLAGYETAEEIAATGAVVIDEKEVFPGDCVQLHGMKVFAEKRVDEAIMDAASVVLSCKGLLSGVFLSMVGGNQRLLKKVDNTIYEEGMGVSAWVDGKRVLIGNRELMRTHEVECPSRDFEARYTKGGRRVLYISNSGELSAMFVVSYNGETRTAERLADLERRGMAMILYTTDPNVTTELVSATFGIRKGSLRILPAKLHTEYNYLTRSREWVTAGSAHQGGMAGILQLLRASASVCHSVRAGAITQLVGIIVGYGLMVAFSFTNSLSLAQFHNIAIYGLAALLVTTLVSNFGKM